MFLTISSELIISRSLHLIKMEIYTDYTPGKVDSKSYNFSWYFVDGYFKDICIEYSPNNRIFLIIS